MADAEISRPPKHKMAVTTTKERLGPAAEGECQVVWLVWQGDVGKLIGTRAEKMHEIMAQSGSKMDITKEVETREIDGFVYHIVFLRGLPDCTREAVKLVSECVGGRLAEDGFEDLLKAVETELRKGAASEERTPFRELCKAPDVMYEMQRLRTLRSGVGFRTLLENLEPWPERFSIQHTGERGATVQLTEFTVS